MTVEHVQRPDSAGACRLDVVRLERLKHVRADEPSEEPCKDQSQGEGGQDEMGHRIDERAELSGYQGVNRVETRDPRRNRKLRRESATGIEPTELDGENKLHDDSEPEDRRVVEHRRDEA